MQRCRTLTRATVCRGPAVAIGVLCSTHDACQFCSHFLKKMPSKTCAVFKCPNTSHNSPQCTFFTIPSHPRRHALWLQLIAREDLKDKQARNYVVCEVHFDPQSIRYNSKRKTLKNHCFPSLHLPNGRNKATQTNEVSVTEVPDEAMHPPQTIISPSVESSSCISNKRKDDEELSFFTKRIKVENDSDSEINIDPEIKFDPENNISPENAIDTDNAFILFNKIDPLNEIDQLNEIVRLKENDLQKDRIAFKGLCNKFLTKQLIDVVKAQMKLKFYGKPNSMEYKLFCTYLYYTSPQVYKLLQEALGLPNFKALINRSLPLTTKINEHLMMTLKAKVSNMTNTEKICSVVVGHMNLTTSLYYNITVDKIVGFHEVNGSQTTIPAKYALVVMIQGILENWKQPIGFALLAECKRYKNVSTWIDQLLVNLFNIGLDIRTYLYNFGPNILSEAKKRSVSIEKPYFFINNKKIYYIIDTPYLMKMFRQKFISNDYYFHNTVAKWKHILQFYESDKKKPLRLAPKLTDGHVRFNDSDKKNTHYAIQLLSNSVATGISAYVDFRIMSKSAKGTAKLIKLMNDLFDVLNSSSIHCAYEYKQAFWGSDTQTTLLNEILDVFKTLKIMNATSGFSVTSNIEFIKGFQITIHSVLLLYNDLKQKGHNYLFTRRLNQEELENVFDKIRNRKGSEIEPNPMQFISSFKKISLINIIKPVKKARPEDIPILIKNFESLEYLLGSEVSEQLPPVVKPCKVRLERLECDASIPDVTTSDYNELDIPENDSIMFISAFLLKKAMDAHSKCQLLENYVNVNQYYRYQEYSVIGPKNLPVIPPDDFVDFVEKMEISFRSFFDTDDINDKVLQSILEQVKNNAHDPPCPCFPMTYIKKLFIRLRIYYIIKFNNKGFRKNPERQGYFLYNFIV